jgi:pimeloyl-ACP methyl ester carboxylesterase
MLTERQFDSGTIVLNYAESEGPRPPLVLLHGKSLWWKYFLPVLPHLAARWHVYALDLRGHGKSGRVAAGYRWQSFVEDCVAFLREQVGEPAVLAGHSSGGMFAIAVAAQHPDLVRALVLEDPPVSRFGRGMLEESKQDILFSKLAASGLPIPAIAEQLATIRPDRDAAWLRWRARAISLMDPETLTMLYDGPGHEGYDLATFLPAISCPVLLLRADPAESPAVTDEDEAALRAAVKDVSVVRFPGVGHTIEASAPDRYLRVVSDFLESLE